MSDIHPTAIVDAAATLGEGVTVGPYSVIGPEVTIGARTSIAAHCVIDGRTRIGIDNRIFPFCSLGGIPQDKKYAGEATQLQIGDRNTIREFCSFNTGTAQDVGITRIGNDNWIMAYVHIAHDVQLGDQTILANNATLAGHVEVGDWAIIGGLSGIHQFCKVGAHVMTGFQSHVSQDIPPYMTVSGNPLSVHGFNIEGLRRRGFSPERITRIKQMHRLLYRDGLTFAKSQEAIAALLADDDEGRQDIAMMVGFLAAAKRGIVR